jgi:hypothetical protein
MACIWPLPFSGLYTLPAPALAWRRDALDSFHLGQRDRILTDFCCGGVHDAFLLFCADIDCFPSTQKRPWASGTTVFFQAHKDRERQVRDSRLPTVQKRACWGVSSMSGLLESGQIPGAVAFRDAPRHKGRDDHRGEQFKPEHTVLLSNKGQTKVEHTIKSQEWDRVAIDAIYP